MTPEKIIEELKDYLEFGYEQANAELKMYFQDSQLGGKERLWSGHSSLMVSCRSRAGALYNALEKIKRLEAQQTL